MPKYVFRNRAWRSQYTVVNGAWVKRYSSEGHGVMSGQPPKLRLNKKPPPVITEAANPALLKRVWSKPWVIQIPFDTRTTKVAPDPQNKIVAEGYSSPDERTPIGKARCMLMKAFDEGNQQDIATAMSRLRQLLRNRRE